MAMCSIKTAKERKEAEAALEHVAQFLDEQDVPRLDRAGREFDLVHRIAKYHDEPYYQAIDFRIERDKALSALEALRTARVTHHCTNCEQMARERDEALLALVRATDLMNRQGEHSTQAIAVAQQALYERDEARVALDGYRLISQGLQEDIDDARRLVARCYLALRFLHDVGAIQWLDPGELAEYETHAVTPEDLEQLPWLMELADVMLAERRKNAG